jgi:hypothetical protein
LKTDQADEQKEGIVRLTLYPSQAKRFLPLLEDTLTRTGGIQGLLCTINKSQDLSEGHLFVELLVARLNGTMARKVQQVILGNRKEHK